MTKQKTVRQGKGPHTKVAQDKQTGEKESQEQAKEPAEEVEHTFWMCVDIGNVAWLAQIG